MKTLTRITLAMIILASLFFTPVTSFGIEVGAEHRRSVENPPMEPFVWLILLTNKTSFCILYFAIFTPV